MVDVFEKRIRRAVALENDWPYAAEVLRFFQEVLRFQRGLYLSFPKAAPADNVMYFLRLVPDTLRFLLANAPRRLAEGVEGLRSWSEADWLSCVGGCRSSTLSPMEFIGDTDEAARLLSRILLQPPLVWLSQTGALEMLPASMEPLQQCPSCKARPGVSVLREDKVADTVRRSLICSLCSHEWDFARVICPNCGEQKTEKLPRYTAQEIPWMRVDGCDTCKKYLKSVDLTLNWEAEPVVDELASTPLDVIAHEQGYTKIAPNLAGI